MAEGKVTSLHVARRAGVSQSAVSRVFSGASASEQTVRKVRKAAEHLGYRPNPLARASSVKSAALMQFLAPQTHFSLPEPNVKVWIR